MNTLVHESANFAVSTIDKANTSMSQIQHFNDIVFLMTTIFIIMLTESNFNPSMYFGQQFHRDMTQIKL